MGSGLSFLWEKLYNIIVFHFVVCPTQWVRDFIKFWKYPLLLSRVASSLSLDVEYPFWQIPVLLMVVQQLIVNMLSS